MWKMGEPGLCVPRLTTLERWIDPEGMPQVQLPIFPPGTTVLTLEMAVELRDSKVVYFNGHLPVFTHAATDIASFRLFTTQLIVNGIVSGAQIARVFGISDTTVKRCVKRYRERGPKAFFARTRNCEPSRKSMPARMVSKSSSLTLLAFGTR